MSCIKLFLGCALVYTPIAVTISSAVVVVRREDPLYIFIGLMIALYAAGATAGIIILINKTQAPTPSPPPLLQLLPPVIVADVEEPPSMIGTAEDRTVVIVENPKPHV